MESLRCGILGCSPVRFDWGLNEEDERCLRLKKDLKKEIEKAHKKGVTHFIVALDCGVGLYAAEMINTLRKRDQSLALICYLAHENLAEKWTPELRKRYFAVLKKCSQTFVTDSRRSPDAVTQTRTSVAGPSNILIVVNNTEKEDQEITSICRFAGVSWMPTVLIDSSNYK